MPEKKATDFGNADSCKEYLNTKFDDLFEGINNIYGKELTEELLHRLEKTVATFHADVSSLIGNLRNKKKTESIQGQVESNSQKTGNNWEEFLQE